MNWFRPITQTHLQYVDENTLSTMPNNQEIKPESDIALNDDNVPAEIEAIPAAEPDNSEHREEHEPVDENGDHEDDSEDEEVLPEASMAFTRPPTLIEIAIELVFFYSKTQIWWSSFWQKMMTKSATIRKINDWVQQVAETIYIIYGSVRPPSGQKEPATSWVNTIYLTNQRESEMASETKTDAVYEIQEEYVLLDSLKPTTSEITYENSTQPEFIEAYRRAEHSHADCVIWSYDIPRDEQLVRVRNFTGGSGDVRFTQNIEYSKVEFLCVEFRVPALNGNHIEVRLPKSLMVVNNELFSPAFMYRWLKYNYGRPFPFTKEYTIHLMDDNVNQYVLFYGDYIVLHKTDIEIVRAKYDNNNEVNTITTEPNPDKLEHPDTEVDTAKRTRELPKEDGFVEIESSDTIFM